MNKSRISVVLPGIIIFLMNIYTLADNGATASDPADPYVKTLLSALTALVESNLNHVNHTLQLLAVSPEVQSGEWEKMQDLIQAAAQSKLPQIVWFALPDGSYYTSEKGLVSQKLNDRSYFPILMAGNEVMAELVVSRSTGKKSIIVAVPVYNNGKIIGAVGSSLFVDDMSRTLNAFLHMSDDLVFYGLSSDGLTAFHRNPELDFVDPREQKSETLKKAVEKILTEKSGEVIYEYNGTKRRVFFMTSSLTGWRIVLGRILGPA